MATVKSIPITIASPPSASLGTAGNRQSASFTVSQSQSSALSTADVNITTTVPTARTGSNRLSDNTPTQSALPPLPANNNNNEKGSQEHDEAATDNEDLSQPLRTNNNNELLAMQSSTNDNESKTFRKSRRKNLFKSIFCCFSTSVNRSKSLDYSKGNAYAPSSSSGNNNTSTNNNNNNNNTVYNNQSNLNNNSGGAGSQSPITSVVLAGHNNNNSNYINSANFTNIDATSSGSSNQYPISSVGSPYQGNNNNNHVSTDSGNGTPQHHHYIQPQQQQQQYSDKNSLLPPIRPSDTGRKCLIIDLDETLVHSSFKQVNNADFVVPVEIDGVTHQVYVLKRPFVDEFLKRMGELFECVLFTASLAKYADPVADLLDKWGVFRARLFREACVFYRGNYVKDLSRLGRDLNKVIILDNSPASYIFHPDNAVPCTSWFDDMHDSELMELIPHFERLAATDNIYALLKPQASSPTNTLHNHGQMMAATSRFAQPTATSLYIHHQHLQLQQQQQQQQQQQHDENQQVPHLPPPPPPQAQSLIYQVQPPQYNTSGNLNINNPLTNLTNNSNFANNNNNNTNASAENAADLNKQQQPHSIPIHQLRSKN